MAEFLTRERYDTALHDLQYEPATNGWPIKDNNAGSQSYSYTLRIFHDNMISHWQGRWGVEKLFGGFENDGPRSPRDRFVKSSPNIYMWTNPRDFNNYYLKLKSYPGGELAHPDCEL